MATCSVSHIMAKDKATKEVNETGGSAPRNIIRLGGVTFDVQLLQQALDKASSDVGRFPATDETERERFGRGIIWKGKQVTIPDTDKARAQWQAKRAETAFVAAVAKLARH